MTTSLEGIQSAVAALRDDEHERFSCWFVKSLADQWDRRVEADILAGAWTQPAGKPMVTLQALTQPGSPSRDSGWNRVKERRFAGDALIGGLIGDYLSS